VFLQVVEPSVPSELVELVDLVDELIDREIIRIRLGLWTKHRGI
jgi:hypothetical protein